MPSIKNSIVNSVDYKIADILLNDGHPVRVVIDTHIDAALSKSAVGLYRVAGRGSGAATITAVTETDRIQIDLALKGSGAETTLSIETEMLKHGGVTSVALTESYKMAPVNNPASQKCYAESLQLTFANGSTFSITEEEASSDLSEAHGKLRDLLVFPRQ